MQYIIIHDLQGYWIKGVYIKGGIKKKQLKFLMPEQLGAIYRDSECWGYKGLEGRRWIFHLLNWRDMLDISKDSSNRFWSHNYPDSYLSSGSVWICAEVEQLVKWEDQELSNRKRK